MSWWDSTKGKIVRFPPRPYSGYPKWLLIDCGCCNGIEWGGEQPRECKSCGGTGTLALHKSSGAISQYPGGPFVGRESCHK